MLYNFFYFIIIIFSFGITSCLSGEPGLSDIVFECEKETGERICARPYCPKNHEVLCFEESERDQHSWVNVSFLATQLSELETEGEKEEFLSKKDDHIEAAQCIYDEFYPMKRNWLDFGIRLVFSREGTDEIIGVTSVGHNSMLADTDPFLELEIYVFLKHRGQGYGTLMKKETCLYFSRYVKHSPILQLQLENGKYTSLYDYVEEMERKKVVVGSAPFQSIVSIVSLNNIPSMCIHLRQGSCFLPSNKMVLLGNPLDLDNMNISLAVLFVYASEPEAPTTAYSKLKSLRKLLLTLREFSGTIKTGSDSGGASEKLMEFWLGLPLPSVSISFVLKISADAEYSSVMDKKEQIFPSIEGIYAYFREVIGKNKATIEEFTAQQEGEAIADAEASVFVPAGTIEPT